MTTKVTVKKVAYEKTQRKATLKIIKSLTPALKVLAAK